MRVDQSARTGGDRHTIETAGCLKGLDRFRFAGDRWSFADASFAPLPDPVPELWFGGASERSVQRALEHGGVWHPHGHDLDRLRAAKQQHTELRMIPAVLDAPEGHVERILEAGAVGVAVRLPDVAAIRAFARRYR